MIYIKRKTDKKSKIQSLKLDEAVRFIADFGKHNARIGKLHVIGADSQEELNNLFGYFIPDLFVYEANDTPFGSYLVNLQIPLKKRLLVTQATKKSIQKFSAKISQQLGVRENNIYYGANFFALTFETENLLFDFVCSYKLEVLNSYVRSRNNEFKYSTEDTKKFEEVINRIFVKQRYYYRKKDDTK
jgi:hypothetical protein